MDVFILDAKEICYFTVKQQTVRISHEVRRNSLQILEQETRPLRERANSLIVENFTENQIEGAVEVCRRSRDYAYKVLEQQICITLFINSYLNRIEKQPGINKNSICYKFVIKNCIFHQNSQYT